MKDFLKELIKLAEELNKSNGFESVVVINEIELLYNNHVAELKNLDIERKYTEDDIRIAMEYGMNLGEISMVYTDKQFMELLNIIENKLL